MSDKPYETVAVCIGVENLIAGLTSTAVMTFVIHRKQHRRTRCFRVDPDGLPLDHDSSARYVVEIINQ